MTLYSRIVGTGSYLPEKILTNADLEKMVDTNDEWIVSRSGIRERHLAADGVFAQSREIMLYADTHLPEPARLYPADAALRCTLWA